MKEYVETATDTLCRIMPRKTRDELREYVKTSVKKKWVDPELNADNNVTGVNYDTTLTGFLTMINDEKPVVSGNATLYVQPEVLPSPTSNMLGDLKKLRKSIKKEMFQYKPSDDEYANLDLDQANTKVIMNAEYGATGTKTSAFYTKWSPPATTLMAQSIITTMANLFESLIGDNNLFMSFEECIDWVRAVLNGKNLEKNLPDWIIIPSREELVTRLKSHFYAYRQGFTPLIENFVTDLEDNERTYVFYAHNLHEFIRRHNKPRELLQRILSTLPLNADATEVPSELRGKFDTLDAYKEHLQTEMFMNPYEIPGSIKEYIKDLGKLIFKYCHVSYLTSDSIEKLNHHKRRVVLLVDTDSNVLYLDPFVQFVKNEVCQGNSFGRKDVYNDMIIVNIASSFLDNSIKDILDLYGRRHNMGEKARSVLQMKNEFLFRMLMLLNAKKSYLASIVLREGHMYEKLKTEIKGVQFIKSAVSEEVSDRFTKIAEDNILFAPEVDLTGMMRDIRKFEAEIIADMKAGGTRYLKAQGLKSESGYSDPWRNQIYKAATVWNLVYPEQKIYPLDRAYIVKLGVKGPTDIECIKEQFPDVHKTLMDEVFMSDDASIRKYGMSVIAIPTSEDIVPEWIRKLMDIELLCSNIMASFRNIMEAFRVEYVAVNTPSKKMERFTNLIKF
jgi:hypothetical protein